MRNISISTCFDYSLPIEVQLSMIKNTGYSHVAIGGNYQHSKILQLYDLQKLKDLILQNGLLVDTIHGYALDESNTIEINQMITNAAASLNAPVVVLHCSSFTFDPATFDERKKDLSIKIPIFEKMAKENNIKFAFENVLPGVATDFTEYMINNTNPEYFGFCYDSAHDQIDGPRSYDLLQRLSSRLMAVHISDRIKELVDHVTPGEGFVEFDKICSILKNANIKFPLLMEVMTTHSKFKEHKEFLLNTYNKAVELYDKIYK